MRIMRLTMGVKVSPRNSMPEIAMGMLNRRPRPKPFTRVRKCVGKGHKMVRCSYEEKWLGRCDCLKSKAAQSCDCSEKASQAENMAGISTELVMLMNHRYG